MNFYKINIPQTYYSEQRLIMFSITQLLKNIANIVLSWSQNKAQEIQIIQVKK